MERTIKIIGVCVFRNDGDGCLTSKWMNEGEGPLVEACKKVKEKDSEPEKDENKEFEGKYDTVWLEGKVHERAILLIDKIPGGRYSLKWTRNNGSIIFEGIGMVFDGLLVATYWGN